MAETKLQFSVHEFLSIMGYMDESFGKGHPPPDSVFNEWYAQWRTLEEKSESLAPMERADLLFDGKVTVNAISEPHLREVLGIVEKQIEMHRKLIADEDPDADEEDLAMWRERYAEIKSKLDNMESAR